MEREATNDDELEVDDSQLVTRQRKRSRSYGGPLIINESRSVEQPVIVPVDTTAEATIETTSTATSVFATNKAARARAAEQTATVEQPAEETELPTSSQSEPLTNAERILNLQTQVAYLVTRMVEMAGVVKTLLNRNQGLGQVVVEQQRRIDRLERLIADLMKNRPAQGEILGCKGDELRENRREDKDDDPNAPKDGELLGPSNKSGMLATLQGESTAQVAGNQETTNQAAEQIEALARIDDELEISAVLMLMKKS